MTLLKSKFLSLIQFVLLSTGLLLAAAPALAALDVEWYPPEIEKGSQADRSKVIVSGRTAADSQVRIDGESITVIKGKTAPAPVTREARTNCKVYQTPVQNAPVIGNISRGEQVTAIEHSPSWFKIQLGKSAGFVSQPCLVSAATARIASGEARANNEGFFEVALELPPGLSQMPVEITTPAKEQKTFLITVDVNPVKEDIRTTNRVSTRKPPAAAKKIRLWAGLGFTRQTFAQKNSGASDLSFQTIQAPGITVRGGYWGNDWGVDLYVRDAPGKIEAAAPYQVQKDSYHWLTVDLKGLYQFRRGPGSRLFGLPSQWQFRFGGELQQIPFLNVGAANALSIQQHSLTMGMIGVGLLLGQERDWSYEAALGYQHPLAASAEGRTLTVASPLAYELQIGAAYKFAPGWRLGVFSYIQSLDYSYTLKASDGTTTTGSQSLFYTTLDLRLGYEF